MSKNILVAVAWPYASGSRHLGHIGGAYLPADVFARYHRVIGNNVLMVSGSDAHGTPITVRADEEGMTASHSAGTITFLSDSKYTLTFSANIKRHGGGTSAAVIGLYLNGTLISGTQHTIDFSGSQYLPISFSSNGTVNAGQAITVKMSLASGTTDVTFDTIDLNVTGKAIDV